MERIHQTAGLTTSSKRISRRGIAHGVLAGAGAVALLGGAGRRPAHAQATPEAGALADQGPRRYVLSSGDAEIVFAPATADGPARFDYRDAETSLQYAGDEIELAGTRPFGLLATVYFDAAPDAFVRYLTLLVPEVNPDDPLPEIPVETLAIRTTQRTSIAGPALVRGQVQSYEAIALEGVAEFDSPR